jgi:hypothetical protein
MPRRPWRSTSDDRALARRSDLGSASASFPRFRRPLRIGLVPDTTLRPTSAPARRDPSLVSPRGTARRTAGLGLRCGALALASAYCLVALDAPALLFELTATPGAIAAASTACGGHFCGCSADDCRTACCCTGQDQRESTHGDGAPGLWARCTGGDPFAPPSSVKLPPHALIGPAYVHAAVAAASSWLPAKSSSPSRASEPPEKVPRAPRSRAS